MIICTNKNASLSCLLTVSKISISLQNWLSPERKRRKRGRTGIQVEEEASIGSRCHSNGLFMSLSNQSRVWSHYPIRQLRVCDVWSLQGVAIWNMNEALGLCDSLTKNTHTHMWSITDQMCVVMAKMNLSLSAANGSPSTTASNEWLGESTDMYLSRNYVLWSQQSWTFTDILMKFSETAYKTQLTSK